MSTLLWIVIIAVIVGGGFYYVRQRGVVAARSLEDSRAEARRWVEMLGGQVYSLDPKDDPAARQALADASERFNAAGAQVEQAKSVQQYRLAQQSAYEGLYYVRAARTSLGLDPGPALPPIPGQQQAGAVSEDRSVNVEGREYEASPKPGPQHPALLPGRHGRRSARAAGLVLRTVVEAGAGRRRLGRRELPGRVDAVLRHGRDGRRLRLRLRI